MSLFQVRMRDRYQCRSQTVLDYNQVQALVAVMEETVEVHGCGNFPTLRVPLRELIGEVRKRIQDDGGLTVSHVKLNGSAASHILASCDLPFNDIDLIFGVDLSDPKNFDVCKAAVLDALLEFLPAGASKHKISHAALKDAYIRKLVKVHPLCTVGQTNADMWSLVTLNNEHGRFIEMKFVHTMRRQFEFSVDSFQVYLDSLLAYFDSAEDAVISPAVLVAPSDAASTGAGVDDHGEEADHESAADEELHLQPGGESEEQCPRDAEVESDAGYGSDRTSEPGSFEDDGGAGGRVSPAPSSSSCGGSAAAAALLRIPITPAFFPSVVAESCYGDFQQALWHLNEKLIDTRQPEEIRGGGLLKYANLIARGFRPARPRLIRQLERYMCSRFFIDFPDVDQQQAKLQSYMANHFSHADYRARYEYLLILYRIVNDSTVCLMGHERRLTLQMIDQQARAVTQEWFYESYQPQPPTLLYLPSNASCWIPVPL